MWGWEGVLFTIPLMPPPDAPCCCWPWVVACALPSCAACAPHITLFCIVAPMGPLGILASPHLTSPCASPCLTALHLTSPHPAPHLTTHLF